MGRPDQPRGPDGKWRKRGGGVFLAGVVALGAAFGVGSGAVGAGGGAAAGSSGSSISSGSGARAAKGPRGKARDRSAAPAVQRLVRSGLKVSKTRTDTQTDCAAHSYGHVQEFFRAHPCEALFRALVEVRDGGAVALVAVAWVDMPDADQAQQLQALMDRPGTGNITELSRERGRQRFSGQYYASDIEDSTVINVQAEPVDGTRDAIELARRARAAMS